MELFKRVTHIFLLLHFFVMLVAKMTVWIQTNEFSYSIPFYVFATLALLFFILDDGKQK